MPLFSGKISYTRFLQAFWRHKPCLFRGACADSLGTLVNCASTEELLKLASQPMVESRLVTTPDYELAIGPSSIRYCRKTPC